MRVSISNENVNQKYDEDLSIDHDCCYDTEKQATNAKKEIHLSIALALVIFSIKSDIRWINLMSFPGIASDKTVSIKNSSNGIIIETDQMISSSNFKVN